MYLLFCLGNGANMLDGVLGTGLAQVRVRIVLLAYKSLLMLLPPSTGIYSKAKISKIPKAGLVQLLTFW